MSYGDNSYGETPIGDDSVFQIIVRLIKNITALFISNKRKNIFISEGKTHEFVSNPTSSNIFISNDKVNVFISNREL